VKIWFNSDGYRSFSIPIATTCSQLFTILAGELSIPERLAPHFSIHAKIDGKDHQRLGGSDSPVAIQRKIKQEGHWREEGYRNGFVFSLKDESTVEFLSKSSEEVLPQKGGEQGTPQRSYFSNLRHLLTNKRRGIGHQRSKSGPAISTPSTTPETALPPKEEIKPAQAPAPAHIPAPSTSSLSSSHSSSSSSSAPSSPSLPSFVPSKSSPRNTPPQSPTTSSRVGEKEKDREKEKAAAHRSPTPTPSRESLPDEQEALNLKATAPHLEPRLSASPPRAFLRPRSHTVASGANPLLPAAAPTPVATTPRATGLRSSLKLSNGAVEQMKKASGHAHRSSAGTLPTPPTPVVDESPKGSPNVPKRSASPPLPPRNYRFTPPPAMLAPVTASPGTLRARAQTMAPKQVSRWVSVSATKPKTPTTQPPSESDLKELENILDRLSNHKTQDQV